MEKADRYLFLLHVDTEERWLGGVDLVRIRSDNIFKIPFQQHRVWTLENMFEAAL